MTAKEFNELLARCWFRRNLTLSISARRSIVLMIVAGTPYRRLGASVGSARRGARPRGCGGCKPDHCDRRQARCFCSSPCCRSSPLPAARPCRRCTVRPSRFARWLTDRQFSELVRHRASGAGTEHHVCRPCWDILSRGCRRNCRDVRVELHLRLHGVAGCRTLSRGAPGTSPFRPAWCR